MDRWTALTQALDQGLSDEVCTALGLLVGLRGEVIHERLAGRLSLEPGAAPVAATSLFDLASLTKPLATTLAVLGLVDGGRLDLRAPLGRYLTLPPALAGLTAAHLLAHVSGLPAWRPFYQVLNEIPPSGRRAALLNLLSATGLESEPGQKTTYSDLGFMLLQLVVEEIAGEPLDEHLDRRFYGPLGLSGDLRFVRLPEGLEEVKSRVVASEPCPLRGRLLQGEVNDENAHALGGVAGQAGLFGTLRAVFDLTAWLFRTAAGRDESGLLSPEAAKLIYDRPFPGQPRSLGFDAPDPVAPSSGRLMPPGAIGHLGFAGTSLWHDPGRDLTAILLTNRTIFGRENQRIKTFRPLIHNLVAEALEGGWGGVGLLPI